MKHTAKHFGKRLLSLVLTLVMLSTLIVPEVIEFSTSARDQNPATTYTPDTSWFSSSSGTYTLTTPAQVLGFFQLLANGQQFRGGTIKLGKSIDLNPGWNLNLGLTSGDAAVFPTAPPNKIYTGDKIYNDSSTGRWFHGTFDGQGYVLRGVYSSYTYGSNGCTGANAAGIFGNLSQKESSTVYSGVIKNLIIQNSYVEYVGASGAGGQMSGICSCLRGNAKIQNCYFDVDVAMRWNSNGYIGCISCYGGSIDTLKGELSNVVWAGTSGQFDGTTKRGVGRMGLLYQNANTGYLTVSNLLNLGIMVTTSGSSESGGYSIRGNSASFTCNVGSQVYGNIALNSQYPNKQTSNPGSWTWMPAFESYFPANVASLQGFKNGTISELKSAVEAAAVNAAGDKAAAQGVPGYAEGSTFSISSADDLMTFGNLVTYCDADGTNHRWWLSGMYIYLTKDIDLNQAWEAKVDWSGTQFRVPTIPTNKWPAAKSIFGGIFDGKGYTISGLYTQAYIAGQNNNIGGLFGVLVNGNGWNASANISAIRAGRVCNLSITNSMAIFCANASSSRDGTRIGGIAGLLRTGGASVENCYIDMEIWHYGYGGNYIGAVAGHTENQDHKVRPFVKNVTVGPTTRIGSVGGNTASFAANTYYGTTTATVTLGGIMGVAARTDFTDTLWLGTFCRNGSAGYTNVVYNDGGFGTSTKSGTCTNGVQASAPNANWTNKANHGTYTPGTIVPNLYAVIGSDVSIDNYGTYYDYGSSFTIASYSQYNTFVTKIAADWPHNYGSNMTFKLTADINANLNWNAVPEVAFDSTAYAGSATFPKPADNLWPQVTFFQGTFNGQGHVIAGMYIGESATDHNQKFGMFKELGNGATVKNLIITNSAMLINTAGYGNSQIGGIVGNISGSNVTLQSIYLDLNIWSKGNYNTFMGGFVGHTGSGANFYLTDLVFAGTLGQTKASASSTELEIPVTVSDGYMSQLIAHSNYKTSYHLNNIVLVGERYSNEATLTTQSPYAWSAATDPDSGTYKLFTDAHNIVLTRKTASTIASGDCVTPPGGSSTWLSGQSWTKGTKTTGDVIIDFYMPTSIATYVNAATFPSYLPVQVSISARTGSESTGSIYTISSAAEFLEAARLSRSGVTFAGYTLQLTADIDLNPNWTGTVAVNGSNRATLPNLPVNTFQGFGNFQGTFDGRNHYVSGMFMMGMMTDSGTYFAPFASTSGGAVIRNLKLINGLIYAQQNYSDSTSRNNNRISGLIAQATGTTTLANVYSSMSVWYNGSYAQYLAGFVSMLTDGASISCTISNCTFDGVVGTYYQSGSENIVPSTSTGMVASQFVAHGGWSANLKLDSYNMNGTVSVSNSVSNTPAAITVAKSGSAVTTGSGEATAVSKVYNPTITGTFSKTVYVASESPTVYEGAHDTYVYHYIHVTKAANYDVFGSKLTAAGYTGYTKVQEYQIGNNYYALWTKPTEYDLFVSFIATGGNSSEGKGRGSVFVSPAGMAYNATKTASDVDNKCTAQIWQLDVDNDYSDANGGMGYVLRLTNGHFVIIDGGYYSHYDARNIYKVLKENNVLAGDPVVDAWFITHLHNDHFGALRRFAQDYASNVTVNAFYYNFPSDAIGAAGSPDESSYPSQGITNSDVFSVAIAMAAWPNAARYGKIHSGQTFGFCGMTATVYATHEDIKLKYSTNGTEGGFTTNDFYDGNDTSVVVQFTFFPGESRSQTFMINGDACTGISNVLKYNYQGLSVLKSDIIQVSHHGFKGMTQDAYTIEDKYSNSTRASVYLWPQDVMGYSEISPNSSTWNESNQNFGYLYNTSNFSGVNSYIKSHAKEVIPADRNVCLTLPYRANSTYSQSYWTTNSNANAISAFNRKYNTTANRDGVASGLSVDTKWEIADWWQDGAYSSYAIMSLRDFYEFVRVAMSNTFSGKTVTLGTNIVLSDFDGNMFPSGTWTIPSVSTWTPIPEFAGTFNGNGYSISGIYSNINQGSNGTLGGFIKKLNGGTIQDLSIVRSAFVCTNTAADGSAGRMYGGIVGESTGTSKIQNCVFDVNVYYKSNYVNSSAGVIENVSGGSLTLKNIDFMGDVAQVSAGGIKGTSITIASGQQMRGVNGILGYSGEVGTGISTVSLENVRFTGTRTTITNTAYDRSADLYYTWDTNNVTSATNCRGGTDRGTAAAPEEGTTANGTTYVYVPQLNKVVSSERAYQINPLYVQQGTDVSSKARVRIIGTMTREAAKRAYTLGFKVVIIKGETAKQVITDQYDVYQTITAAGAEITAEQLGGEYIYAVTLTNIPKSGTFTIEVTSRFRDQSGNEHWGAPVGFTITNGVLG